MTPRRQKMPPAEAGFALIEVMVSALVILIVSVGTFGLLQAMTRASAEQRHSSQAYALAQEDQSRLRSMQLVALNHLDESRSVSLGAVTFTVHSTGLFINNTTSTVSCVGENISADYARVTSEVTWPGMAGGEKPVLKSIVSPTNNSIESNNGTLTVAVTNEKGEPKAGVDLKVNVYSDTTNVEGCATFPNLAAGSHSVEARGEDANLVSPTKSGYVETVLGGVGAGAAKVTKFIYDSPGTIPVKFQYRVGSSAVFAPSSADTLTAVHATMKEAKLFGTPGGTRLSEFQATPLFPFTSPYSVYAGSCESNLPSVGPALASAIVPAGGIAPETTIQLPALNVTVWSGKNEANKGTPLANAEVWVRDVKCSKSGQPVTRIAKTNASGTLDDAGFPWSEYELCADTVLGSPNSGSSRRHKLGTLSVKNLTSGTTANFYLGSGTGAVSTTGECS
jgi:Tfp pilus assembly protein PilV